MFIYILFILCFVFAGSAAYAGISAAPWFPTLPKQKQAIINSVDLKDGMFVYDLGCGSGTLLFAAVKKNPNIHAIGCEISLLPYLIAKTQIFLHQKKYKNVSIKFRSLFKEDVSKADIIFVFLTRKVYSKLLPKLKKEVKSEAKIVVEAWPLLPVPHGEKIDTPGLLPIFIYKGLELTLHG